MGDLVDFRSCRQRGWLKDFLILLFSIFPLSFGGNRGSFLTTDALIKYTGCRLLMRFLSRVAVIYAVGALQPGFPFGF